MAFNILRPSRRPKGGRIRAAGPATAPGTGPGRGRGPGKGPGTGPGTGPGKGKGKQSTGVQATADSISAQANGTNNTAAHAFASAGGSAGGGAGSGGVQVEAGPPPPSSPTYIGAVTGTAFATSITIAVPSGPADAGDFLIAGFTKGGSKACNVPAGWTNIECGGGSFSYGWYWKVADGGETQVVMTTDAPSSTRMCGAMMRFSAGVGYTKDTQGAPLAGTGTSVAIKSLTPTQENSLLIAIGSCVNGGTTWAPPVGMEEKVEIRYYVGGTGVSMMMAIEEYVGGTDPTGTRTFTLSASMPYRGRMINVIST